MYVYYLYGIEDDNYNGFNFCHLAHLKKFSDGDFNKMCEEGLSKIVEKSLYCLKEWLIAENGFKELQIVTEFSFEEVF